MAILNHRGFSLLNKSLDSHVEGVDNSFDLTGAFLNMGKNLSDVATNMKYEDPEFSQNKLSY